MAPVAPPAQTLVTVVLKTMAAGCVMVAEMVLVQAFASVTVTV